MKAKSKLPMNPPPSPKASEKPTTAQSDADQAHGEEVLHQHAEHVLAADHAAVEEREALAS